MKTHWSEIWDQSQEYKTSGWNGIIEDWYQREIKEAIEKEVEIHKETPLPVDTWDIIRNIKRRPYLESSILRDSYYRWQEEQDSVRQIMLDYEESFWTTLKIGRAHV